MLVLPQIKHKNVLYNIMDILERIEKGDGTWQFGFFYTKTYNGIDNSQHHSKIITF